jgi:hypothetical protein
MAKISGVLVSSISKIAGKTATTISKIAGKTTSGIPGWPSAGPTCTTYEFGYSDGRRSTPADACTAPLSRYELDETNLILYNFNSCGTSIAAPGFYSDGVRIFNFTNGVFVPYGRCGV